MSGGLRDCRTILQVTCLVCKTVSYKEDPFLGTFFLFETLSEASSGFEKKR